MVETEEEARKILKKLNSGKKDFAGLAMEYSKGPEGEGGGDMGYFEARSEEHTSELQSH